MRGVLGAGLLTQTHLAAAGIAHSDLCVHCGKAPETAEHVLWHCPCGAKHRVDLLGPGNEEVDTTGWSPITKATGLLTIPEERSPWGKQAWFPPPQATEIWERVRGAPEIRQGHFRVSYTDGSGRHTSFERQHRRAGSGIYFWAGPPMERSLPGERGLAIESARRACSSTTRHPAES